MNIQKLKSNYESACNAYIKAFEEKQDVELEYWVSDKIGGVACFGDVLCFNMDDIVYDINNECKVGQIIEWAYYYIDNKNKGYVNYSSYDKGFRY